MPNESEILETIDPLDPNYTGDCPDSDFPFHSPMMCEACKKMLREGNAGEILLIDVVED